MSDTSRILKDIKKAFSRSNTEGRTQCIQSQRRRFYASSACRGAIPVSTVATPEVLRSECLSRCYPSVYSRHVGGSTLRVPVEVLVHGAYSRHVGGSTLRVPVEVLSQCLQSPRRRFYAPSACRGASPWCLQSQRRRFYASSACRGAIQRRLSSQRRRFYAPSWKCHIRRDFKDTATSRRPPPPLRQNQNEDQTS